MPGKMYYLTTLAAWQRHAHRFTGSHWIALETQAVAPPHLASTSQAEANGEGSAPLAPLFGVRRLDAALPLPSTAEERASSLEEANTPHGEGNSRCSAGVSPANLQSNLAAPPKPSQGEGYSPRSAGLGRVDSTGSSPANLPLPVGDSASGGPKNETRQLEAGATTTFANPAIAAGNSPPSADILSPPPALSEAPRARHLASPPREGWVGSAENSSSAPGATQIASSAKLPQEPSPVADVPVPSERSRLGDATPILVLVEGDEGAHLALESDADFHQLPHPLAQQPIPEAAHSALASSGVALPQHATTFEAAESLARIHPLLRHRVF